MKNYIVDAVDNRGSYVTLTLMPATEGDHIIFWPGQYATLSLRRGGHWSPVRCLSFTGISNKAGVLEFAFRVTGDFTRDLANSLPGDRLRVQGPFGNFIIDDQARDVVLIAGGIGITPFMSMLRTADISTKGNSLTLLYACSSTNDIPYQTEIRQLSRRSPVINSYFFVSTLADGGDFLQGPINKSHLISLVGDRANGFVYYICGPEGMMKSMVDVLGDIGVTDENIFTESFAAGNKNKSRLFGLSSTQLTYALSLGALVLLVSLIGFKDIEHKLFAARASEAANTVQLKQQQTIPESSPETDQSDQLELLKSESSDDDASSQSTTQQSQPMPATPTTTPTQTYGNSYNTPQSSGYQSPRSQVS